MHTGDYGTRAQQGGTVIKSARIYKAMKGNTGSIDTDACLTSQGVSYTAEEQWGEGERSADINLKPRHTDFHGHGCR